jgi:uncharacterized integral membrane protein
VGDEEAMEPRRGNGVSSKVWVIGILIVLIVILFIQNSQEVHIDFLFADTQISLFFALLLSTVLGFALGWLVARLRRRD